MNNIDYNCFIGNWPFHKVRNQSIDALCELHKKNGISGGYVSSTNAIFYNDPYEAELELSAELPESYFHVMTVNPMLPGYLNDIERAVRDLNIMGVRILPGFHGYTLGCDEVARLCELLRKYRLPLFLTLRMEDERVTYLLHPNKVPIIDVRAFLNIQTSLPILLCNIRLNEIMTLQDIFLSRYDVYADCSGLKDGMFVIEKLDENHLTGRLIYGSLAPIFCLKSSLLMLEKSQLSLDKQNEILSGEKFLHTVYRHNNA